MDSHYLHIIKLNLNKSKPKIDVLGPIHWPQKWSFIDAGDGNIYGSDAARNTAICILTRPNNQIAAICKSSFSAF